MRTRIKESLTGWKKPCEYHNVREVNPQCRCCRFELKMCSQGGCSWSGTGGWPLSGHCPPPSRRPLQQSQTRVMTAISISWPNKGDEGRRFLGERMRRRELTGPPGPGVDDLHAAQSRTLFRSPAIRDADRSLTKHDEWHDDESDIVEGLNWSGWVRMCEIMCARERERERKTKRKREEREKI